MADNERSIIISVGTSILESKKKILKNDKKYSDLKEALDSNFIKPDIANKACKYNIDGLSKHFGKIFKDYNGSVDILRQFRDAYLQLPEDKWAHKRENNELPRAGDKLAAEHAGLYLLYKQLDAFEQSTPAVKDKIILLVSESDECVYAAYVLSCYFTQKSTFKDSIASIEIYIIKGLRAENNDFVSGLKNLMDTTIRIINEQIAENRHIFLNITGGYKGILPYLTLLGMAYEAVDLYYLFEFSATLVRIPKLPFAFDLLKWRDYRGFLKAVPMIDNLRSEYLTFLTPGLKNLFEKKPRGGFQRNALGDILKNKYHSKHRRDISEYGTGYQLTEEIKDLSKQEALRACINLWQYLWIGDKIPETVNHARGHAQRDLELAAQIIKPLLKDNPNIFGDNQEERDDCLLRLIATVWLHDLGHSGNYFIWESSGGEAREYNVKGFPTLVRDTHHLLTYQMITDHHQEYFCQQKEIFTDQIVEDIKRLCLYHRGKMPAIMSDEPYKYLGVEIKQSLTQLEDKLPLLGALFRIIDEGEVQNERAVGPLYQKMRKLQNKEEIKSLLKEAMTLTAIINKVETQYLPECINELLKLINSKLNNGAFNSEELAQLDDEVDDVVREFTSNDDFLSSADLRQLLRDWLNALNQIIFKQRQPSHFDKHDGISAVLYYPDYKNWGNNKGYHFKIKLIHRIDSETIKTQKLREKAEEVGKKIIAEYNKVKPILDEYKIYFDRYEVIAESD